MEVDIPNPESRLKPGMYARVQFVVAQRPAALTVPRNALVDLEGARGVFVIDGKTARFRPVQTGIVDGEAVEITEGLSDNTEVVTLGSASLRDGDPIVIAGQAGRGARGGGPPRGGQRPGGGA
jgi:multidrug efflux pump subunit AcrA (membrane-fusion protein)